MMSISIVSSSESGLCPGASGVSSSAADLNERALSYLTLIVKTIESRNWNVRSGASDACARLMFVLSRVNLSAVIANLSPQSRIARTPQQTLLDILTSRPKLFKSLSQIISTIDEFNRMTFLHGCMRYHPPACIVSEIIEICPEDPRKRDCLNRTPLHVACGVGASYQVIQCLTAAYPEACEIRDYEGRTPLHYCCDCECNLFESGNLTIRGPPSYEVVLCLLTASISMVNLEDVNALSPLECAICSGADEKVVNLLQEAAQKYMRYTHCEMNDNSSQVSEY